MMTEIYESKDHLLILSGYGDPNMHSHSASHILVSNTLFHLITEEREYSCYGALVPCNISHTVKTDGSPMLVFMFDETTSVSLEMHSFECIDQSKAESIMQDFQSVEANPNDVSIYHQFVDDALHTIGFHSYTSRIRDDRIQQAIQYIHCHCGRQLTCAEVADAVCLSESRFSHLFRKEAGITFASFLILRRLEYAYDLLSCHASITEAALEAGFSDPSHFAYINQKMLGLTARAVSQELCIHHMI